MIDINKKYQTRDGRPARVICVDRKGCSPVVALIMTGDAETTHHFHSNGKAYASGAGNSHLDLIPVVEKTSKWSPIWLKQSSTKILSSREDAVKWGKVGANAVSPLVGVLEYKYEDDVFVDAVFHKESGE